VIVSTMGIMGGFSHYRLSRSRLKKNTCLVVLYFYRSKQFSSREQKLELAQELHEQQKIPHEL